MKSSIKREPNVLTVSYVMTAKNHYFQRVINVPISAPWHTPRDGYTSSYSPSFSSRDSYSSRDFFSPSYTSSQTFDYPISARETSWRSTNRDTPTYTRVSYRNLGKYIVNSS